LFDFFDIVKKSRGQEQADTRKYIAFSW